MFSFFNKPKLNFSVLQTDMHSHLLPGIDDGAKTLEKSIEYIHGLQALGYQKFIATPHILSDHYPNTPEIILGKLAELKTALKKAGISIQIEAAAEYYLDEYFMDLLQQDAPLLTLDGKRVLMEFSTFAPPHQPFDAIFQLKTKGYQPVLAHPERYIYYSNQLEIFEQFRNKGCELQVNLLSIMGHYGPQQQELAQQLLKKGWIDYLGTDLHHGGHLESLQKLLKRRDLQRLLKNYSFKNKDL